MSKVGLRVTVVGTVALVVGLGIDAWLHIQDPTLAAREALLTFENAGHVLMLGGVLLVVAGVSIMTIGPRIARASSPVRFGAPLASVVGVLALLVAGFNSSLAGSHDHDEVVDEVVTDGHAHSHGHGHGEVVPYEPLEPEDRAELARQLTEAREVATRYPTVADAESAGYRAVTPYIPLIGAHYMNFLLVDGTFDVSQPEMLLYDGTDPESQIVGLSYYVLGDTEPEGFAGPNDHWHRHIGLCIDPDRTFVVGDEQTTEEECERRGGVKVDGRDGWMVHAWVVPGWESPQGVFSAENAQLQ
jgi:hypothetical protein